MSHKAVLLNNECFETKNELSDDTSVTSGSTWKASAPSFTRFVHNSNVNPALVEAGLAHKKQLGQKISEQVKSRIFWASNSSGDNKVDDSCLLQDTCPQENVESSVKIDSNENDLVVVEGHTGSSQGVVCQLRHQMVESMSDHSQTVPGVTNDTLLHTGSTGSTDSVNVNDRV